MVGTKTRHDAAGSKGSHCPSAHLPNLYALHLLNGEKVIEFFSTYVFVPQSSVTLGCNF
jgi:hypothetical protein